MRIHISYMYVIALISAHLAKGLKDSTFHRNEMFSVVPKVILPPCLHMINATFKSSFVSVNPSVLTDTFIDLLFNFNALQ